MVAKVVQDNLYLLDVLVEPIQLTDNSNACENIVAFSVRSLLPDDAGGRRWGNRARTGGRGDLARAATIASHSTEQDFYFGDDFLLRRYDYYVDIAGGFADTQYV